MLALPRIGSLATALVVVATLAACGEDGAAKNDYVDQVNVAQTRYASTATKIKQQITTTSTPQQDRSALTRYVGAIDTLLSTLRSIKVPGEVNAEHGRLVAATADLRGEVAQIAKQLRSATTRVLADAQRKLGAATITFNSTVSAATDAINTKLRAG